MKRHYKFLSLLLAGGMLTACSSDEPVNGGDGMLQATFSARIGKVASRAAGTEWAAGDAIGISGVSGSKTYSNVEYSTGAADGNFSAAGESIYYQSTDPVTFIAYYPYTADLTGEGIIPASTADQSQQPSFDFLWAQAQGSISNPAVNFSFQHCMSRLSLTFINGNNVDLSDLTFSIDGLVLDGTFDTATGEAAVSTDAIPVALSVIPLEATADRAVTSVILFPQIANDAILTVTAEGSNFISALPITQLQPGTSYRLKVNVTANGIEVSEATSSEWTNGGEEDVPAMKVVEKFTAEQLKIGDYVYVDGTFSDGGLRYRLEDGNFVVIDVAPVSDKTPIGVVFHLRNSSSPEDECEYTELDNHIPTGYIVSVIQGYGPFVNSGPGGNDQTPNGKTHINGYKYTNSYYNKYHETVQMFAINWCKGMSTVSSTDSYAFTPWYMPSMQEYILMRGETQGQTPVLDLIRSNTKKVSGMDFTSGFYSTCGLMGYYGNYLYVYNLFTGSTDAGNMQNSATRSFNYRAVCAFRVK